MQKKEVDLRDCINMVRKRWKIILIIFLVSTITSGVVSFLLPKTYESIAMVRIGKMRDTLLEEPSTVIEIFKRKPILSKVAEELNILPTQENLRELASNIRIQDKSGLLEIRGRAESSEGAFKVVNGATAVLMQRHEQIFERAKVILEEYLASGKQRQLEMEKEMEIFRKKIDELRVTDSEAKARFAQGYMDSLEKIRGRYEQLQIELTEKKMEESYSTVSTELVIPSTIPEKPIAPKKKQNVLIAGILGLFVGFICATIVEYFEKPRTIS